MSPFSKKLDCWRGIKILSNGNRGEAYCYESTKYVVVRYLIHNFNFRTHASLIGGEWSFWVFPIVRANLDIASPVMTGRLV